MFISSRLKRGPGAEAKLFAALSVKCRSSLFLKRIVCSSPGKISRYVGTSTVAQSDTAKLVSTAAVEFEVQGGNE